MEGLVVGKICLRKETGNLYFDFRYRGKRCREYTALPDTPGNRKKLAKVMKRIEAEITLGSFDYAGYFPDSRMVEVFAKHPGRQFTGETPLFSEFAYTWLEEMSVEWRQSHVKTEQLTIRKYLVPAFGDMEVSTITKADILRFRAGLAKMKGHRKGRGLSASRINHIMTPLRMILNEAAERFHFKSPYFKIKPLKVPKTEVEPFTLKEVKDIIDSVRPDFRNYYIVRFFTGMRTAEIDGLIWKYVDLEKRQILVRQAIVNGEIVEPKNESSYREIDMSEPVYEALVAQKEITGNTEYVFCTRAGTPLQHNNVTKRVWYPLLRYLGLRKRRPYQTRHTAATLWLASGENPEWIARQMGHSSTKMLFDVYSRYVPNLTRKDGSAFERLLVQNNLSGNALGKEECQQTA
jgi:integrase